MSLTLPVSFEAKFSPSFYEFMTTQYGLVLHPTYERISEDDKSRLKQHPHSLVVVSARNYFIVGSIQNHASVYYDYDSDTAIQDGLTDRFFYTTRPPATCQYTVCYNNSEQTTITVKSLNIRTQYDPMFPHSTNPRMVTYIFRDKIRNSDITSLDIQKIEVRDTFGAWDELELTVDAENCETISSDYKGVTRTTINVSHPLALKHIIVDMPTTFNNFDQFLNLQDIKARSWKSFIPSMYLVKSKILRAMRDNTLSSEQRSIVEKLRARGIDIMTTNTRSNDPCVEDLMMSLFDTVISKPDETTFNDQSLITMTFSL